MNEDNTKQYNPQTYSAMYILVILCAIAWLGQALKDGANIK